MRKILFLSALVIAFLSACTCAMAADTNIEVHGFLQNRVYLAPGANAEFRSERISLSTKATFENQSQVYVELYYHPWTASNLYVESAYYQTPVDKGLLRVGKGRRVTFGIVPAFANRKTSNYGIVAEAITQDRIQGIQYLRDIGKVNLAVGLHSAYRLGSRPVGDVSGDDLRNNPSPTKEGHTVSHLALREANASGKMQISGRAGIKLSPELTAGLSGSFASLDPRDVTNLTGAAGSDNTLRPRNPITNEFPTTPIGLEFDNNNMSQIGLDATYKRPNGMIVQGELYGSSVSDLNYNVWNILTGLESPSGWKYFIRYAQQNMDIAPTNNPLTWDITQTTFSIVQPLRKNAWLQYEYEINSEKTDSGANVANNLFFVELFTAF
ncbi:MAG: hypothetical protein ACYC27_20100 [Armatimonadota bacterium]